MNSDGSPDLTSSTTKRRSAILLKREFYHLYRRFASSFIHFTLIETANLENRYRLSRIGQAYVCRLSMADTRRSQYQKPSTFNQQFYPQNEQICYNSLEQVTVSARLLLLHKIFPLTSSVVFQRITFSPIAEIILS